MVEAYPLKWPLGKPRTPIDQQKRAQFTNYKKQLTVADGVSRIEKELDDYTRVGQDYRVEPESIIISSNVPPTKKGKPRSGLSEPEDNGVAVYFNLDGQDYCFECDKWNRVADNMAAIAAHIFSMRKIEHYGVGQQHDIYTGFKALPEKASASTGAWWQILGVEHDAPMAYITAAYKQKVQIYHPDKPTGNRSMFDLVQTAYEEAKKARQ